MGGKGVNSGATDRAQQGDEDRGAQKNQAAIDATGRRIEAALGARGAVSGRELYRLVRGSKPRFERALHRLAARVRIVGRPGPRGAVLWSLAEEQA